MSPLDLHVSLLDSLHNLSKSTCISLYFLYPNISLGDLPVLPCISTGLQSQISQYRLRICVCLPDSLLPLTDLSVSLKTIYLPGTFLDVSEIPFHLPLYSLDLVSSPSVSPGSFINLSSPDLFVSLANLSVSFSDLACPPELTCISLRFPFTSLDLPVSSQSLISLSFLDFQISF
jgi:hypothetical protein